jgi:hypothetical protein
MSKETKDQMATNAVPAMGDALEGARRATANASPIAQPNPEVAATARRRQFTSAERTRILDAADACKAPGDIGALLRREGMRDICERENIAPHQVVLHSDNGSPMKGATMLATLQSLGVMPSFSRPAVSNDNPYSESLFKTLKYRPNYPSRAFENLLAARQWVGTFVHWYNHEHCHSAIRFVTPHERHAGQDTVLLSKRVDLYEAAKARYPQRWSGTTRNWQPVSPVHLVPER